MDGANMTIDRLIVDPRFLRLTDQQKTFTKTSCSNGNDKIQAAIAAWECKSSSSAQTMANRFLRTHPEIKRLIAEFFGTDPTDERLTREEWLSMAAKGARTADKPADSFRFLNMIGNAEGWFKQISGDGVDAADEEEKEKSTMELVHELEKKQ